MTAVDLSPQAFMTAAIPAQPIPSNGNTAWAAQYARELRDIVINHTNNSSRNLQKHLGPSEIGHPCLHGDTEVVTRHGIRRIRDLAKEGHAELLVPLQYKGSDVRKRWGKFVDVPVEQFGEQELFEVTLRRNRDRKVVYATAEHGWFRTYYGATDGFKNKKQQRLTTAELLPGHKLTQLRRARPKTTTLMPVAVAQGFVFGDGTSGSNDDRHRPAILNIHHNGKDEALLPYFPDAYYPGGQRVVHESHRTYPFTEIKGLPRFWKQLPPINESTSFLLSWLAGYFAADGSVAEDGHCTLDSAYEQNLQFVQAAAAICGVGYGKVHKYMRRGISHTEQVAPVTPLYRLSLRRADLPEWFFLTAKHAERARIASLAQERDPHWTVESVKATGRTEPVYCAVTGDVGAFALADDLMTANCHRQVAGKLAQLPVINHTTDPWASIMGVAGHVWMEECLTKVNELIGRQRFLTEHKVTPIGFEAHPGTGDGYDYDTQTVIDHKFLGRTNRDKLKTKGAPRHYFVQTLLYALGFMAMGLPVHRVALIAWPRTESYLDDLYVWEHVITDEDLLFLAQVIQPELAYRKQWAAAIVLGQATLMDVPNDTTDACELCPFYRPASARDGQPGCPGHATGQH